MKNVFVSAGEVSGDKHAYLLCKNLIDYGPDLNIHGFVSIKCENLGINNLSDSTLKSGVGLIENIPAAYHSIKSYKLAKDFFIKNKIDLLILIDNQGFNLRLAKLAKKNNIKVAYYIGPQEWIWGFKNGTHKIMKNIDILYTIFKREHDFYQQYLEYSSKIKYFGHPLLANLTIHDKNQIKDELGFNQNKPLIALMPGSRKQELSNLLPIFTQVYHSLKDQYNFMFIFPLIWKKFIEENFDLKELKVYYDNSEYYMQGSDLIIAASGTVTLEAVIYNIPVIPCYKLNKLSYLIAKILVKLEYITLPNIVAGKKVINELIQDKLTTDNIIAETKSILEDKEKYNKIKEEFKIIKTQLEPINSVEFIAKDIINNYLL